MSLKTGRLEASSNVGIDWCVVKIQVLPIRKIGTVFLICEAKENDEKKKGQFSYWETIIEITS